MRTVKSILVAAVVTLAAAGNAVADSVSGEVITTDSQVNGNPVQSRSDTIGHPVVEINYGDANDFSWMVAGDSIDIAPYPNPNAPNSIDIRFGATHDFAATDVLTLTFTLPADWEYGVAAIVVADNVGQVVGGRTGNVLYFDFYDLWTVSEDDFGGRMLVVFNALPVVIPGDMNCDNTVDFFDIDPFLLALFDAAAYTSQYPGCASSHGDMNGDTLVNFFDIDLFVACVFGACP